ncbi:DinB family protein [Leptospira sp. GIMC2001]|uniref:DinB family protein n=1 Tax=Leptospira sp. GIMC2001 TaxID=1513297 RepID=UPI0023497AF1|nr:DinB family protein [Leptospira sp. GIMC2001]WCL47588.1 hypothetical protein O4O04_01070 [Leptospira sp. GIMC2001]
MNITKTLTHEFAEIIQLLNQFEDHDYSKLQSIIGGSSIGQHVRHIFEFSECLLYGQSKKLSDETIVFSYDDRKRNYLIEQSTSFAISNFKTMIDLLESEEYDLNMELNLQHRIGGNTNLNLITTFGRELLYILDHTIHHLAIIRIAVEKLYPWIDLPKEFGFTESTIRAKTFIQEKQTQI